MHSGTSRAFYCLAVERRGELSAESDGVGELGCGGVEGDGGEDCEGSGDAEYWNAGVAVSGFGLMLRLRDGDCAGEKILAFGVGACKMMILVQM